MTRLASRIANGTTESFLKNDRNEKVAKERSIKEKNNSERIVLEEEEKKGYFNIHEYVVNLIVFTYTVTERDDLRKKEKIATDKAARDLAFAKRLQGSKYVSSLTIL